MICKCKNCGSATKYDPISNKMVCLYCDSSFDAGELEDREYVEYNVYSCSQCGGELRINGVEASTFCPYCGQPSIAYSRVSRDVKPDLIVPFSVTKEEAVEAVRQKFKFNFFLPKEIKNFDIDKIRGIYMPFWIFDANYTGKGVVKSRHGSKHKVTYYHYRYGKCDFTNLTADASMRFTDESSQRLEPFDISKAVPFDVNYLSGFYADRYDVEDQETLDIIRNRARKYYEDAVMATVSGSEKAIYESDDDIFVGDARYALLPVWFLTFRYNDRPYTFLINGQTKKVVGGVPFLKSAAIALGTVLSVALFFPLYKVTEFFWSADKPGKSLMVMLIFIAFIFVYGYGCFEELKKANDLTTSREIKNMVAEREEEQ